ncbi:hypothetical protein PR202_ga02332 [Eleusine coracana subsp. coracana]|uniref:Pectinesterase inhibitor domain-containing protein n=1 Tax=Eleusine coracana subsp. coracana TaxID=191504 RepID=A0AAV5BMI3_ELECO|nr:hypothetical protein PR202_ga02332 [Eleusine coracana subsp. coracana]
MAQAVATLILAMAITPALEINNSSVVKATCAALKLQPYDYCVSVLSNDTAAGSAIDARGVATAAINMTAHKAASLSQVITYLIDELNSCREIYNSMEATLASVLTDLQPGRFNPAVLAKTEDASEDPTNCDILLFEGKSHKDPISDKNGGTNTLARLATAIVDFIVMKRQ